MALNYITVTLDLYDGQGNQEITGEALFTPSAVLTDAGIEIIGQQPIPCVFRASGLPAVKLLATDNSGPVPTGWTWGVTFTGITGAPAGFSFFLPALAVSFTATNATPCVFTVGSGSAPANATGVQLSGGSLPAGFSAGTTYYVVAASGATFELAASIGGSALASTSTGSGTVTVVSQLLSNLIPVSSGTAFQAYMPLPSGTPSANQVPLATGTGEASAWGNVAINPMTTLGDTVYGGASGAITRLAGDTSNTRKFLREQSSGGVAAAPAWDTIQAADVPTLNQNTTGTAANITGTLDQVPAPAASVSMNSHKITSVTAGTAATDAANVSQTPGGIMTTLGDILFENATPAAARLAGSTSATKNFLTQTGTGSVSAAPAWGTIAAGDMPTGTTSAQGALQLDGTAADITMNGTQAAGAIGKAADSGHVHPTDTSRAQDSLAVHLAGTETITGAKTFNLPPNLATQSVSGTATLAAASAPVVLTDTTSAAFTLTLPASPVTGEWFIIVDDTGKWNTNNLTIGRNGKNIDGAAANLTLLSQYGKVWLYYDGTAWWTLAAGLSAETPVATGAAAAGTHMSASRADHVHPTTGLVTSVAATDTSIVVGGTSQAPTIATGTLDVIATQHAPAANWSNNSHKITSLSNGGAAQDAAAWGQTVSGILTTLGDTIYENSTPSPTRLAGNTSATKNFLTQTGTGSVSAAPAWGTIAAGDLPTGTTSAQGALQLDGTAGDIQPTGAAPAAGAIGKAADAGHIHASGSPVPSLYGLKAWTYDSASGGTTQPALGTAGTVFWVLLYNPLVQTLSTLYLQVGTAGGTLTAGQCFAGLYSISGGTATLQAAIADQSGAWNSTGLKTANFTSAYTNAPVGSYGIGVFFNGTTGPAFRGSAAPGSQLNCNLSGASLRCASTNSTGNTTAMPNSITISSNSNTNAIQFWAGLS